MIIGQLNIRKPSHKRYILHGLSNSTYVKYATVYSRCKRNGNRDIMSFLAGTNLLGLVRGNLVQYGKRRIATVVLTGAAYVCAPTVAVVTNATRTIHCCHVIFTTVGFIMEAVEDASHMSYLPLDLIIFGQPIIAVEPGRFSTKYWGNMADIIDNLPGIHEQEDL